ncbi:uncharacterized protein LOC119370996 [Jatropha curcas]|uniref:uncharacterized protein LOC119370996 n=1 Tax=Jatropha curcas TaxID=180498 RepID=UPI0018940B47|nr:uncharacterized protein LOC119370996 [Jatropha curcas]
MLKVAWEKICADRYADFTYRMRRSGKKQRCVSQEIWESWQKAWEDPAFKRKREMFAQNRRSETGGDGAGPSRHTGGSISAIETARLLAKELGREPTPIENYTTASGAVLLRSQTDESEAESRIDEVPLISRLVRGEKKRKGIRHRVQAFTVLHWTQQLTLSTASAARHLSIVARTVDDDIRAQLADQQRRLQEL